jgi:hypothetical protein
MGVIEGVEAGLDLTEVAAAVVSVVVPVEIAAVIDQASSK